jgi:chromosome segregation ATPase
VEEWDSLEQMNAEFNEQSDTQEAAMSERKNQLDEFQALNEKRDRMLLDWSHRLNNQKRRTSVLQSRLAKEYSCLRTEESELSAERGRILRIRTRLKKEQTRISKKGQEIRKLARKFISITQD